MPLAAATMLFWACGAEGSWQTVLALVNKHEEEEVMELIVETISTLVSALLVCPAMCSEHSIIRPSISAKWTVLADSFSGLKFDHPFIQDLFIDQIFI